MSRDKSLKSAAGLTRHRNVLSRAERIDKLKDEELWTDGREPFGLPKVAHRKASVGKKSKAKETEDTETTEAAPAEEKKKP